MHHLNTNTAFKASVVYAMSSAMLLPLTARLSSSPLSCLQARARQGNASSATAAATGSDSMLHGLVSAAQALIARVDAPPPAPIMVRPGGLGARASELRDCLLDFMSRRVYPSEAIFEEHAVGPDRWSVHPLMEQLKDEARELVSRRTAAQGCQPIAVHRA